MTENRIKNSLVNLATLGVGCIIALVLLEIGLRIFPIESRVKGDEIVLPANKKYTIESSDFFGSNFRGIDKTISHSKNSVGFRGPELPKDGLEHYLSILTVGGSTTECFYLSDGKDWPLLLQEHLRNEFSSIWLNNAGLDGHSTFGHTVLLKDIVLELKPKIIMFLVGANDIGRKDAGKHTASHLKGSLRLDSVEGFVKSASAYSEVASTALNIYRYFRAKSRGLTHKYNIDIRSLPHVESIESNLSEVLEPHITTFVPAYEKRLRALIRLARSSQVDPVLITQPFLYGKGNDPLTGVNLATLKVGQNNTSYSAWTILELYNEVTKKVGEQENVLTIDLAHELEKTTEYFYDEFHYTNSGSEKIAQIIYNHLQPYLEENYGSFVSAK